MTLTYRTVTVDGLKVFYRTAGDVKKPAVLLLHGFPTSSHMFRDLIPALADRYYVVAPDLPGFGYTDAPDRKTFKYSFEHLTDVIDRFTEALKLNRYAIYVFDYGAPVGLRLALRHPERIGAIISQNGNAYLEGLSEGWKSVARKPRRAARFSKTRDHAVAVQPRREQSGAVVAGRLDLGLGAACSPRQRRDSTRSVRRLSEQHRAVSEIPGLHPHKVPPASCRVGQERPVLPAARRPSLQAR